MTCQIAFPTTQTAIILNHDSYDRVQFLAFPNFAASFRRASYENGVIRNLRDGNLLISHSQEKSPLIKLICNSGLATRHTQIQSDG
jgi:hypothetical protein